jgi:hypothetical protein
MTSDSTPAFEIEKEALKTEIETGIKTGVDHLEDKPPKRNRVEKYHNTRHLLKQYRKVAYAIQISETDMNVRMEMEHGTRLSTLEVNAPALICPVQSLRDMPEPLFEARTCFKSLTMH